MADGGSKECSRCHKRRDEEQFQWTKTRSRRLDICKLCVGERSREAWQGRAHRGCIVDGCDRPHIARKLCTMHYRRWHQGRSLERDQVIDFVTDHDSRKECQAQGCLRTAVANGWCSAHWQRVQRHGDPDEGRPIVDRGARRYVDSDGYVVLRADGHSNGTKGGSIFEHVKVMSETIGRPLKRRETVHHRNGVRDDNRPENLELWSGMHPRGARVSDQIRWAIQIIETYGDDPTKWEEGRNGH